MKDRTLHKICASHGLKITILRRFDRNHFNEFNNLNSQRVYACNVSIDATWYLKELFEFYGWGLYVVNGKIEHIYLERKINKEQK